MENIINSIYSRKIRLICVLALILTYSHKIIKMNLAPSLIITFILVLEISVLMIKEDWWSSLKYIIIWTMIIILFFVLKFIFSINMVEILWPLVWILGLIDSKYNRISIILAFTTTILVTIFSITGDFQVQNVFALVGVYMGIRSLRIRQEAYRTSQLHLQELNEYLKELKEVHEELQEASVHSMRYAALEERTRIAREIHDGIGHQLTSLIIQLQALEFMLKSEPDKAEEQVKQLLSIARKTMSEVRLAVKEWADDEMGLGIVALRGLISQTQAHSTVQFDLHQDSDISEWSLESSVVIYRILQESLTNILRHSNATSVEIHLKEIEGNIVLSVSDNGDSREDTEINLGFGIRGMIERAKSLGGNCKIYQLKTNGFCIEVMLPINPETNKNNYEKGE